KMVHGRSRPRVRAAGGGGGAGARGPGAGPDAVRARRTQHRLARYRSRWRMAQARGWHAGETRMNAMDQAREIVTVMLPDRVDSETALGVEKSMLEALQPGARVIVDGSDITYMSAAGVRALAT